MSATIIADLVKALEWSLRFVPIPSLRNHSRQDYDGHIAAYEQARAAIDRAKQELDLDRAHILHLDIGSALCIPMTTTEDAANG